LDSFESGHARATYGDYLTKLLSLMALTPEACSDAARMDVNPLWTRAKVASQTAFTPKEREAALNELRNYLRFNGIYQPHDHVNALALAVDVEEKTGKDGDLSHHNRSGFQSDYCRIGRE